MTPMALASNQDISAQIKAQAALLPGGGNQPSLNCDGVDDTIRLQAAISAGGTVTLPTGTCVVSGTGTMLTLVSNLAIVGQGMGVSTIKVKGANGDYDNILGPANVPFTNVSFSNLTIDQNTTGNPTTANMPSHHRISVATGGEGGGQKLSVTNVEFKDVAAQQTIYSGSDNTDIINNVFTLNCSGTHYYDSSIIYTNAEHVNINDNRFNGCLNGAGSVTAIETHGGNYAVTGNVIDNFWQGMNITGVALTDSNNITVTGNTINDAYFGIHLWAIQYKTHTTGYGLHGLVIDSNPIRLTQTAWTVNPGNGLGEAGQSSCIWFNTTNNLPVSVVTIANNTCEYDLESSSSAPYQADGTAIGWQDYYNSLTTTLSHVKVLGNTIKNAPINAIHFSAAVADVEIARNTIIDAGSSQSSSAISYYQNGIMLGSVASSTSSDIRVDDNIIIDDLATSRMVRGIYVVFAGTVTQLALRRNRFSVTGGTPTAYLYPVDLNNNTNLPQMENIIEAPGLGSGGRITNAQVALGSSYRDATTGYVWHVAQDGATWLPSSYNSAHESTCIRTGQITWNTTPSAFTGAGWSCTSSGTPGTWNAIPVLGPTNGEYLIGLPQNILWYGSQVTPLLRWAQTLSDTESGTNTGSDMFFCAYADNGSSLLGCYVEFVRASGYFAFKGSGMGFTEGAGPPGSSGQDQIWGDSTAHRLKMNNNNGGAQTVAALIEVPQVYNHSGTIQASPHTVQDSCVLGTSCSVTLTGASVFTSSTSYTCACQDNTAIDACNVVQSSGSAFAITGTGTDTIRYICTGN